MASVWKRLQRVNKRAAKFQYTASYHRIDLETSPKWKPNKLSIVWTRRSRRVVTDPVEWEPSLKDPLKGSVIFTVPENQTVAVTLFKDSRTNELEDKDWTFVLEDVSVTGKRRRLAICALNMRKYASLEPSQRALVVTLEPTSRKVLAAALHLTLHAVLLREGQATDEDMQSLASLLSVNNNSDIAVLEDLDEDDYTLSDQSTKQMSSFRERMEEMTQSLTNSDIAATPNSVQSLNFDSRTPTAPLSPVLTPTTPVPADPTPTVNDKEIKTSTPKNVFENKDLKSVVFKPKTVAKRDLKCLELKTNLCSITLDGNENEKEDVDKTPTGEVEKLFGGKLNADKTPVQDLLEWCQTATREYRACRVTNLTTSFRSGLAFCAIIHYYRPDLIDFSGLQPEESERNVRVALEASGRLGIAQVLAARDVCVPAPDRLAIMTYLFQLRAHFTGSELQVEQLGNSECESSYLVGRHDTDEAVPRELFSREVVARRSARQARPILETIEKRSSTERSSPDTGTGILNPRNILNKVLASPKDKPTAKWFDEPFNLKEPTTRPEKLMTRKELTDPFGSDEEDEQMNTQQTVNEKRDTNTTQKQTDPLTSMQTELKLNSSTPETERTSSSDNQAQQRRDTNITEDARTLPSAVEPQNKSPSPELPKPTPQLLSRHDELKERARLLLEATKKEAREKENKRRQNAKEKEDKENLNGFRNGDDSPKKGQSEEERQAMLRERARKLIADARAGIVSPTSPASPTSPSRPRAGAVEIISKQSVLDEIAAAGGIEQLDAMMLRNESMPSSPASRKSISPDRISGEARPTLHSFSAMLDRLTPDRDDETLELEVEGSGQQTSGFLGSELAALEREQAAVDAAAAALEKQLRAVMDNADEKEEDRLMSQWFNLVNKKNALLRRQMQLNILEQEEDLSRRCELLEQELRASLAVDEWRKTPDQKHREILLLQELLKAVNERDRLVHEMDEQERAIADDDEIERNITNVDLHRKNNCILQ